LYLFNFEEEFHQNEQPASVSDLKHYVMTSHQSYGLIFLRFIDIVVGMQHKDFSFSS